MSNWRPYDPEYVPDTAPDEGKCVVCANSGTKRRDCIVCGTDRCAVCGNPKEPHRYRHVFVSELRAKEATSKVENAIKRLRSTQKATCKLHADCRAADEMVRAAGGRSMVSGCRELIVMTAKHEN